MARWEPDSRDRLARAALELYGERGFERTTVAEIAARAGVTERTFFRHFADKREVLFGGSLALQDAMEAAIAEAPHDATPVDAVAVALDAVGAAFVGRRPFAQQRHAVITASTELRERELSKLASLAATLAEALRRRDVPDPTASLTAEIAIAVFRVAFEQWVDPANTEELTDLLRDALGEVRAVAAPVAGGTGRSPAGTGGSRRGRRTSTDQ